MNEDYIKDILNKLENGEISAAKAMDSLKDLPYRDLGFANVDHHRVLRNGFPEVIYCQGKTSEQIRDIFLELTARHRSQDNTGQFSIMATRATPTDYQVVKEAMDEAEYFETARIIAVRADRPEIVGSITDSSEPTELEAEPSPDAFKGASMGLSSKYASSLRGRIAVVTAGTADIPVAEEAAVTAELMGNRVNRIFDVGVAGIHRLFDRLDDIRSSDVIIVIAGMDGALASVLGGLVDVPVIAVPTSIGYGSSFEGLAALLSMMNSCSNGVTVVNIDNGFGAAYSASIIVSNQSR